MTWVRLRLPGLRRTVEFICLLPLTDPGHRAGGRARARLRLGDLLPRRVLDVWLCFAYVVLVLPYAYRALDAGLRAIDVRRSREAARSLGRELVHRDVAGDPAQHPHGRAVGGLPLGGAGPRRVHHRQPAQPRQPAGGDQPARQAQRLDLDRRVLRRPASSRSSCCSPCPSSAAAAASAAPRRADVSTPTSHAAATTAATKRRRRPPDRPAPQLRRRARPRRPDLSHRARRAGRAARAVGLRQDHRPAAARRPRGRRRGPRRGGRPATSPGCPPTSATWGWCSRRTACSRT